MLLAVDYILYLSTETICPEAISAVTLGNHLGCDPNWARHSSLEIKDISVEGGDRKNHLVYVNTSSHIMWGPEVILRHFLFEPVNP